MRIIGDRVILSPSDINDYVECEHLTTLAHEVASGRRSRPRVSNEYAELLRRKGEAHETADLARLRAEGRVVVDVSPADPWDLEAGARATVEAMRAGADVIYQATFVDGDWCGRADFLERVERETALGPWGYEPVDAKLARAEKPTYVLQLCFYSEAIEVVQGVPPLAMHVLLGTGARRTLRYADFSAYYRRVRRGFTAALGRNTETEPYPVEHCALCDFREVCDERWTREDHLVLVAGMRRDQVKQLRAGGIATLSDLAGVAPGTRIEHVATHTLEGLNEQAALQLVRRTTGRLDWRLLPVETGRGFERLPRPSRGDVIFDIEGDPFWEPARGLHFLFGLLVADGEQWRYQTVWAHDRAEERLAFETLVDILHERLARYPDMHVYHYGTYEMAAMKQMMGVYATREDAVDEFLRRGLFVDLHGVVRQGLRAGVSSYSLKQIEALPAFRREAALATGGHAVLQYERWMDTRDEAVLPAIAAYNEEDCRATLALREWLLLHRPEGSAWADVGEPKVVDDEKRAAGSDREALRNALVIGAEEDSPRSIAGELLEYHRREARPAWWWFFARSQMTVDELIDDAEAIGRLEPTGVPVAFKRSLDHQLYFPLQQHKLAPGDTVIDPATGKPAGTIQQLDDTGGALVLRRGPSLASVALPKAVIPPTPYGTPEQRAALARFATSMLANDGRYPALRDIVVRARPRFVAGVAYDSLQTTDLGELRELAATLDGSYLFIQGPPGTGKTWTGARIVVDLIRRGQRVGITATSHKAIHNMLDEVEKAAREEGVRFHGVKKASSGNAETEYASPSISSETEVGKILAEATRAQLFAGTAWLFAHRDVDAAGLVDTLVIDEAGQVALADAVAMGAAARNVILLGDPLQLAQVSQGTHPAGTGVSVLEHLLAGHATVAPQMGVFLDRTRRMHPDVCRFVSEVVYDGRLQWMDEVAQQATAFGTGLRYLPVEHAGNTTSASEEATRIASEIAAMLGAQWTSAKGVIRQFEQTDFMVVAPYNAQVRRIRRELEAAGLGDVPVGTVDKFQGREAPIVFYSMASSSAEDIPRGLEFLFSRNRLNVAVSRAMCLAYLVASPKLLESRARTIDQMRLVNALCRFVELAETR
jgi:predicted RecB family nuclease